MSGFYDSWVHPWVHGSSLFLVSCFLFISFLHEADAKEMAMGMAMVDGWVDR